MRCSRLLGKQLRIAGEILPGDTKYNRFVMDDDHGTGLDGHVTFPSPETIHYGLGRHKIQVT